MQTFNYFLFICFINVCNSFTLINNQIRSNFLSRHCKNKLNMGCDYYIDKNLCVYDQNDIQISYINIEHERCYYNFVSLLDEDEDGYETEFSTYIENLLNKEMKPIVIYGNNTFNKLSSEIKYKRMIEEEIKLFNKSWNDISKIIKTEYRYERE